MKLFIMGNVVGTYNFNSNVLEIFPVSLRVAEIYFPTLETLDCSVILWGVLRTFVSGRISWL